MKKEDIDNIRLRDKDIMLKMINSNTVMGTNIYIPDNSTRDTVHVFQVVKTSELASEEISEGDIVYVPWAMTRGIVDLDDADGEKYTFSDLDQVMLVLEEE